MTLHLVQATEVGEQRTLEYQAPRYMDGRLEVAYKEQDCTPLLSSLPSGIQAPQIEARLITLEDGYVAFIPFYDGLVFTKDKRLVYQTSIFSTNLNDFDEGVLEESSIVDINHPILSV